jgi:hypothetical protein
MNCKNCDAGITFLTALKQPTPYRVKCPACKTKYKISTPYMGFILLGVLALAFVVGLLFYLGGQEMGIVFVLPFLVFTIGVWLILDVCTYRYMSKHGVLTTIDISAPNDADDDNN